MRGLYAIADVGTLDARGLDPVAFAKAVLRVSPAALQLRAKDVPPRQALAMLRELAPMCHCAGIPLIANDRPDLAVLAGCDLVHVGQTDMPIDRVRRIAPGLGVGVSTHTLEQLDAALATRPAYVAFGPVFETSTKSNPDPIVGLAALRTASARAQAAGVPLVAVGGITRERVRELAGLVNAVAVVSGLLPPVVVRKALPATADSIAEVLHDVAARALAFQQAFVVKPHAAGAAP
jgi:thiamine-phosphate pyrophosphorylase